MLFHSTSTLDVSPRDGEKQLIRDDLVPPATKKLNIVVPTVTNITGITVPAYVDIDGV